MHSFASSCLKFNWVALLSTYIIQSDCCDDYDDYDDDDESDEYHDNDDHVDDDDDDDDGKSGGCEGWLGSAIDSQDGVMCHGRAAPTKIYTPTPPPPLKDKIKT